MFFLIFLGKGNGTQYDGTMCKLFKSARQISQKKSTAPEDQTTPFLANELTLTIYLIKFHVKSIRSREKYNMPHLAWNQTEGYLVDTSLEIVLQ